ncbi:hypothetical protein ASE90_12735 [Sphingomonas sp. Leaf67]|uniref:hypothetical protein n=1 Tax=Sphingomonas sp. Leaf67 TaxID=1736230 RepID=UPI0006FFA0A4|nr:hypothetical protein [Sphingomonas sp. Leaf67]KQN81445.1 hypothetical protein ASE90_12735 [Sphingomonas sp. Leaf67]
MADPRPANDSAPVRPSLFDRALGAARPASRPPVPADPPPQPAERPRPDRAALILALAIVAAPLLTLAGATLMTAHVRRETRTLTERSAPAVAARTERDRGRAALAMAWNAPTLGATVEAIARALPEDAALLRVERNTGPLTIDVAAPDPDRALSALRRDPALGGLRAVAQSRADGDGRMRITLEQPR